VVGFSRIAAVTQQPIRIALFDTLRLWGFAGASETASPWEAKTPPRTEVTIARIAAQDAMRTMFRE
jgi:hypothetical protein